MIFSITQPLEPRSVERGESQVSHPANGLGKEFRPNKGFCPIFPIILSFILQIWRIEFFPRWMILRYVRVHNAKIINIIKKILKISDPGNWPEKDKRSSERNMARHLR